MKKVVLGILSLSALTASITAQAPQWNQVASSTSPSPRYQHEMAYDGVRGKMVMFGGDVPLGPGAASVNDTWEFDGVDWTQVTTASSPAPRTGHTMVYDWARGKVVMFGGVASLAPFQTFVNATWEYDGVDWTQVTPISTPPGRTHHAMAYDTVQGRVVMFGGYSANNGYLNDMWELTVARSRPFHLQPHPMALAAATQPSTSPQQPTQSLARRPAH